MHSCSDLKRKRDSTPNPFATTTYQHLPRGPGDPRYQEFSQARQLDQQGSLYPPVHLNKTHSSYRAQGNRSPGPYHLTLCASTAAAQRPVRAAQACDSCRTLKAKCDEGRPACSSCAEKNITCIYRDPLPKLTSNEVKEVIRATMLSMETVIKETVQKAVLDSIRNHFPFIESSIPNQNIFEIQEMPNQNTYKEDLVATSTARQTFREEDRLPVPSGKPFIPVNHTTGLLLVSPIAQLARDALLQERFKDENYPMRQEIQRGLLRLWESGEGIDPEYEKPEDEKKCSASDSASEVSYLPGPWGQSGGLTPPGEPIQKRQISPYGSWYLNLRSVAELVDSYMENIHILHPILVPKELDLLVANFNVTTKDQKSNKRKWSEAIGGYPKRSIGSAIVLLVMALGEICQVTGRIPDCVSDRNESFTSSPIIRNNHPPSPPQRHKNLDAIPGLAFFAFATDIIGNQAGGNTLQHVCANILASLYHGQLGRPLESHAYLNQACRSLQVILIPEVDRFKKLKYTNSPVPVEDNPLIFAFWTCWQMESDIVAELPVPHSGISTYEEDMPSPNLRAAIENDSLNLLVAENYEAQLYLQKHLNRRQQFDSVEISLHMLEGIKQCLLGLQWKEDDPPAKHILSACLQAKYYSAKVIICRNFLLESLERSYKQRASKKKSEFEQSRKQFTRETSRESVPDAPDIGKVDANATTVEDIDDARIHQYAVECIKGLIKSTTAFHGLDLEKRRLIVTNIWGTAHAQWGNLITLLAVSEVPRFGHLINKRLLQELFDKTIAFLKLAAHPSSALSIDHRILEHIGIEIGLMEGQEPCLVSRALG